MKRIASTIALLLVSLISFARPAFEVRGLHIDLRTQTMTIDALKATALAASKDGLNTIIMEWEANYPFQRNATLRGRYAYSVEEVKDFIGYCESLGIDVIPLQNCFGHADYILRHARYAHLREERKEISQVCPCKIDECSEVFRSMFEDIADLHNSRYIHIGGDETRLLGRCPRCAKKVAQEGVSALFVDYVNAMCEIVHSLGKTPIIWSDMILKHPEAAERLTKDVVILDWNYGWSTSEFGDLPALKSQGFEFWGAPALRSDPDNLYLISWKKHFKNLEDYTKYALEQGFAGIIETSWSTSGNYGTIRDYANEIYMIQPVREVYPLSAFDILLRAYGKAVNDPAGFETAAFIDSYAEEHFGITAPEDKALFRSFFMMPQNVVSGSSFKADIISKELDASKSMRQALAGLSPSKNKADFAQYLLTLDIRANYLAFKAVECRYESADYAIEDASGLAKELSVVLKDGRKLRKRFVRANSDFLKDPASTFNDWTYLGKVEDLMITLENQK